MASGIQTSICWIRVGSEGWVERNSEGFPDPFEAAAMRTQRSPGGVGVIDGLGHQDKWAPNSLSYWGDMNWSCERPV